MKNLKFISLAFALTLTPAASFACACGASLLDVGTSSLIPNRQGGIVFLQYDYISQNTNWHKDSKASADDNDHKKINTKITTLGAQYMFNKDWGANLRLPHIDREATLKMHHHVGHSHTHSQENVDHSALGDIKLTGIYTGLSKDMSFGLIFGAKLPTGRTKQSDFSSAMAAGTGSYDAILGFYKRGKISPDYNFGWFTQGSLQKPIIEKENYRPGREVSFSLGANYNFRQVGVFDKITPILQLIASDKKRDSGINAENENSGYRRLFIAPAIELNLKKFTIYADYEMPIYENVNGNQLAVEKIFKIIVGYNF